MRHMPDRFLQPLMLATTIAFTLLGTNLSPAGANTCSSQCAAVKPVAFVPGERITVVVINRTKTALELENAGGDRPIRLQPGQKIQFYRGGSTDPNLSVVFWESTETPLKAALSQPKKNMLQIDLTFAATRPGDRSIYIRNDGRIDKL
jgi:hypothetical protein